MENKIKVLVLVIAATYSIGSAQNGGATSLFQCQPSSDQSGLVYTPNIPDFYFDHQNVANYRSGSGANLTTSRRGFTYIFTFPSELPEHSCSGNLISIQYCYEAEKKDIRKEKDIFRFLSLTKNQGNMFTIDDVFTVRATPENDICSQPNNRRRRKRMGPKERYCCDTATLTNQLHVSSADYAFGVSNIHNKILPLGFASSATEYRAEHFQMSLGSSFTVGNSFHVGSAISTESLLLLRLFIEPDVVTTESITTAVTTTEATTEPAATTTTTTVSTTTSPPTTTPPATTFPPTTTSPPPPATTSPPTTTHSTYYHPTYHHSTYGYHLYHSEKFYNCNNSSASYYVTHKYNRVTTSNHIWANKYCTGSQASDRCS